MSDVISQEIEQIADQLEKSGQSPKERLFETIRKLGPAGIRAKLPSLEKAEQELLLGALQEMKKAVEMDANYAAPVISGKITDTKLQEEKGDDEQDEKLVKPEAAMISHQGTPTPGWEGQVIKGKEMSKEKAKDTILSMEEKEHKTKDPKKLVEAEKKEHAMKKSGEEVIKDAKKKVKSGDKDKMKEGLKEMKKAVEEQLGDKSTPELVKGEMKRLLAEESQEGDAPKMDEATRAKKESVPAIELGKDNKKNMTKAAVWGGENDLIKACTQGRNFHFSAGDYLEAEEAAKTAKKDEPVAKSEGAKKEDLNDIIEKGGDRTWDHLRTDQLLKSNDGKRGKLVKSYEDNEIAQALGLTPEEAKKILGE